MKIFFKAFFKYILMLLLIFALFFTVVMIYHLLPTLKISLKHNQVTALLNSITVPSFYHALYNSLIFSVFIFGILILNYLKKYRYPAFFIPLLVSTLIVFIFLNIFKPNSNNLNFNQTDDARTYFSEKNFFEHQNKKFYFDNISKTNIKNAILIEDGNINFYKNIDVNFLEDRIFLNFKKPNGKISKVEFPRDQLSDFNASNSVINTKIFKLFGNITYRFVQAKSIYVNVFIWFAIAFFLLSFTTIMKLKDFPFLSIMFNCLFLILFYYLFNFAFDIYYKLFFDILALSLVRDIFLGIIFLILGVILQSVRIIFMKTQVWGND